MPDTAHPYDPHDPLNRNGDGSLGPGNPIFDAIMGGATVVSGTVNDDGTFDMKARNADGAPMPIPVATARAGQATPQRAPWYRRLFSRGGSRG